MEDDKKVLDIKTRKAITCLDTEPDTKPEKFLQTWKRFCKDTKVKSVMIITIDDNDYVTYGSLIEDDYHESIAILSLDDLKEEMREQFFEYDEQ